MKTDGNEAIASGTTTRTQCIGLTKREYFAGLAMQGMLSSLPASRPDDLLEVPKNVALWAVMCADALISALNKEDDNG